MRHLPSVGVMPTPRSVTSYLVVRQDNNGSTFIITATAAPWLDGNTVACTHVQLRLIGAWTHPTTNDIPTW